MVEKQVSKLRPAISGGPATKWLQRSAPLALVMTAFVSPQEMRAQNATDPAAASGMTTGLPGVSTARQAELMQVRARAQAARPEAERAAMERSADQALDQQSQDQILNDAREMKAMKEQAARQLEHQKAANAYRGVTPGEINSWADDTGRVKVERGVPPEILASLAAEEEEPSVEEEPSGFNPFKLPKKAAQGTARAAGGAADATMGVVKKGFSWIPGIGKDDKETGITATPRSQPEPTGGSGAADSGESKTMLERVPLLGGLLNRDGGSAEPAPTVQPEPVSATGEEDKPGLIRGLASSLPLIGGKNDEPVPAPAPVPAEAVPMAAPVNPVGPSEFGPASPVAAAPPASEAPPEMAEKTGMLSGFKGFVGRIVPGGKSDGLASGNGTIDASLFPQDGDSDTMMADPAAENERKKLFSLKNLPSLPELPQISAPSAGSPEPNTPMPKKDISPVHSGGNANYVVQTEGAQFMRFGSGPLGSEMQSLRAGTVVTKTKVGDEWSTITLADGSTGNIRNGDLKPATGGQAPTPQPIAGPSLPNSGLATVAPGGNARITSPVSATGAGVSDVPGPPVSIPSSELTEGRPITAAGTVVPPAP